MIPGLPRGQRARIYERIVDQLQTDPVLSNVVKTWWFWDRQENQLDNVSTCPIVHLTPTASPQAFASPESMTFYLQVRVNLVVQGQDARDAMDLWEAIELALYPKDLDRQRAFQNELSSCEFGCVTGLVELNQPATWSEAAAGMYGCDGMMQILVRRLLNP